MPQTTSKIKSPHLGNLLNGYYDFLSFGAFDLELGPNVTVITGPNGVGKSNLGRCLGLARAVVAKHTGASVEDELDLFRSAGRNGANAFNVALGLAIDQPWERQLVTIFMRAAYACGGFLNDFEAKRTAVAIDAIGRARLTERSLEPLWAGTLHIQYDAAMHSPWFAAWEFQHGNQICLYRATTRRMGCDLGFHLMTA